MIGFFSVLLLCILFHDRFTVAKRYYCCYSIAPSMLYSPAHSASRDLDPTLRSILEQARWAPSGDNTQPWRFEVCSPRHVRVHGFDTREHCVYDLDGRPSRLSIGAMLETLRIATSTFGLSARIERNAASPEAAPVFDVHLEPVADLPSDPLAAFIEQRCVQRRPLQTQPLTGSQRQELAVSVGPDHDVIWFEGFARRFAMARLMFQSAHIRLTIEEAYRVHASVIEWHTRFSEDRLPDAAVGLDPVSLAAMRWVMRSWPRTRFVSKYLGGTFAPRVQLDLLPGVLCAAHAVIVARSDRIDLEADFAAGRAVQRFWLSAEKLQLRHQPEMTPLIFSRYAAEGRHFTDDTAAVRTAGMVRDRLDALLGADVRQRAVWIGRIGAGPAAQARSLRRPLDTLLVNPAS